MTAAAGMWIAFGLVIAAWVSKAVQPTPASNGAGWVLGLIGTLVLLLAALGIGVVVR